MQCERCQQEEASVHLTQVLDGHVAKMHLCEQCAREAGVDIKGTLSITDLLSGLTALKEQAEEDTAPASSELPEVMCPHCGMDHATLKKSGRLGCSRCYVAFEQDLRVMTKTMHHHDHHVGKIPQHAEGLESAAVLRKALDEAIRQERYEEAARLRDRLRLLDGQSSAEGDA